MVTDVGLVMVRVSCRLVGLAIRNVDMLIVSSDTYTGLGLGREQ